MRNEERLHRFLHQRWVELGKPEVLPLSANEIAKEWTIIKNERTVIQVPVEVQTSRTYVVHLLRRLEEEGFLTYDTANKVKPIIKIISNE